MYHHFVVIVFQISSEKDVKQSIVANISSDYNGNIPNTE